MLQVLRNAPKPKIGVNNHFQPISRFRHRVAAMLRRRRFASGWPFSTSFGWFLYSSLRESMLRGIDWPKKIKKQRLINSRVSGAAVPPAHFCGWVFCFSQTLKKKECLLQWWKNCMERELGRASSEAIFVFSHGGTARLYLRFSAHLPVLLLRFGHEGIQNRISSK